MPGGAFARFAGFTLLLLLCAAPAAAPAATGFHAGEADLVTGRYAPLAAAAAGDSLVVVSFNIRYGEKIDQALADLRADPLLAGADIILLQEMDPEGCHRIARGLGYDFVYYPASIHPHHDRPFGNAILTRGHIVAQGLTHLPTEGLLAGTQRLAVFADVVIGARTVRVVSVHTSTVMVPAGQRRRQVRLLLDSLAAWTGPVVVGGDFNTVSAQEALNLARDMRRAGLREARLGDVPTVRLSWQRLAGITGPLDHIFCRGLRAGRTGVVATSTASDHFPVWAVLGWEEEPAGR